MSTTSIALNELAPAFRGRPQLAPLWQRIADGATAFTPEEQTEIILAEARMHDLRGDIAAALARAQQALSIAEQHGWANVIVTAYAQLASTHYFNNTYRQSVHFASEALKRADDAPDSPRALIILGLCAFDTNDWSKAEACFQQAIQLSRQLGQFIHLSTALLNFSLLQRDRGQFALSLATLDEFQRLMLEMGIHSDRHAMGRAWIHLMTNQREAARQALADLKPFAPTSSLAEGAYHLFVARLAMDEDDFERAEDELRRARAIAETTGIGKLNHWLRTAFSRFQRGQSDAAGALTWAQEALTFAQRFNGQFEEAVALVARARAWWALDDFAAAHADLLAALAIAKQLGADYLAAEGTFLLVALRHQQAHDDPSTEFTTGADATWLDATRRIKVGGYGFILERERALAFPLVAAHARSRDAEVRKSAETMLDQLATVEPLPLRIVGLGQFAVWQGRRLIAEREWQQRRAGELFRFLLLQLQKRASRDLIYEALCPTQSPQAAQTFLHHATSTLRRILDPDLPDKFPSRYLFVEAEQVELRLHSGSSVDFEDFEKKLSTNLRESSRMLGEDSRRFVDEHLLTSYQGDLFPLDRYADWPTERREQLAELYVRALHVHAQQQLAADNPQAALDACNKILKRDVWREDAVWLGMKACLALNDRPGALRLYRDLERALRTDLQIFPRTDLQALAASIRNA